MEDVGRVKDEASFSLFLIVLKLHASMCSTVETLSLVNETHSRGSLQVIIFIVAQ